MLSILKIKSHLKQKKFHHANIFSFTVPNMLAFITNRRCGSSGISSVIGKSEEYRGIGEWIYRIDNMFQREKFCKMVWDYNSREKN